MAGFGTASKYIAPAPVEKPNPFVDDVKVFTDQGIDTLFPVTFDGDDYKAEKLLIQAAANKLGFSVREHETDYVEDIDQKKVNSVFRVRPLRKRKGDKGDGTETDTPEAGAEA